MSDLLDFIPVYPDLSDPDFAKIISNKVEFSDLSHPFLFSYQVFVRRFLSPETPYKKLLLFHNMGSGKSFSAISVAEDHRTIFQKQPLVLVKNVTIANNFRKQIKEWRNFTKKYGHHIKEENMEQKKGNYEIKTFIIFARDLSRRTDDSIREEFEDRIIIIDEIQNLRTSYQKYDNPSNIFDMNKLDEDDEDLSWESGIYHQMWRLIHLMERSKVLLLSGTPMVDKREEICGVMNLILPKDSQITNENMEDNCSFLSKIRGYVSFSEVQQKMPDIIEEGQRIGDIDFPLVISEMKGIQKEIYNKTAEIKKDDFIYRNSIYCSLAVLPGGVYGREAYTLISGKFSGSVSISSPYDTEKNPVDYIPVLPPYPRNVILKEGLSNYSCKLQKILEIIEKRPRELAFIFCEEVKGSGLVVMACLLEVMGYSYYQGEDIGTITKAKRYTFFTGDKSICKNPEKRLKGFCSYENRYGEYITILMGSRVSGEGISLTNVRQVHILTPHWNVSSTSQAIARAVRSGAHEMLKVNERTIRIYRHIAINPDLDLSCKEKSLYSIDYYKYQTSQNKSTEIKNTKILMERASIDFFSSNVRPNFSIDKRDFSTYIASEEFYKDRNKIFRSSFDFIFDQSNPSIHIRDLEEKTKRTENILSLCLSSYPNFYKLSEVRNSILAQRPIRPYLHEIIGKINNNFLFLSRKNRSGIVNIYSIEDFLSWILETPINEKGFALELAIEKGEDNILLDIFENSILRVGKFVYHILFSRVSYSNCSYAVASDSIKNEGKTRVFNSFTWSFCSGNEEKEVLRELRNQSELSLKRMEEIFGIICVISNSDNQFRLIIGSRFMPRESESIEDKRKENRGKRIISFSNQELAIIATYLFCNNLGDSDDFINWIQKVKTVSEIEISSILGPTSIKMRESHHIDIICILRSLTKKQYEHVIPRMCIEIGCFLVR